MLASTVARASSVPTMNTAAMSNGVPRPAHRRVRQYAQSSVGTAANATRPQMPVPTRVSSHTLWKCPMDGSSMPRTRLTSSAKRGEDQ